MLPVQQRIECILVGCHRQYCRRRAPSDRYALAVELVVFGVGHFLERLRLRVPPPVTVTAHEVIGQKPFNPGGVGSQVSFDTVVLQLARAYEQATDCHKKHPGRLRLSSSRIYGGTFC